MNQSRAQSSRAPRSAVLTEEPENSGLEIGDERAFCFFFAFVSSDKSNIVVMALSLL